MTLSDPEIDQRGRHRKYLPYAFTEQGVAMLSAVLRSETAIQTTFSKKDKSGLKVVEKLDAVIRENLEALGYGR